LHFLTVVVANQQMRSTTNLLIINLAVSDILFVIFCVPFTATDYVLPEWPFGNVWCKFVQYMIVVTCHCRWVVVLPLYTETYMDMYPTYNPVPDFWLAVFTPWCWCPLIASWPSFIPWRACPCEPSAMPHCKCPI